MLEVYKCHGKDLKSRAGQGTFRVMTVVRILKKNKKQKVVWVSRREKATCK